MSQDGEIELENAEFGGEAPEGGQASAVNGIRGSESHQNGDDHVPVLNLDEDRANTIKARRRQLRGKITRSINRLREAMEGRAINERRLQREMTEIRKDISVVCDLHSELYDHVPDSEYIRLDNWEASFSNDRHAFEEKVEDYLASLTNSDTDRVDNTEHGATGISRRERVVTRSMTAQNASAIIRKDFAVGLGLQGKREHLELSVVGGERLDQSDSRRVKFWISPVSGGAEYEIEAHEIDKTVVSVPPLDRPWLASFPHLADLEFSHKAGPIDLILGIQYSHLHVDLETRQGLPFEPVGKRTELGWIVMGADSGKESTIASVSFVQKCLGVRAPDCSCPERVISPDNKKAMDMFETSCHKEGSRFVIGLPWKRDPTLLPDNYPLAEKRLLSLERSLLRKPEKASLYNKAMDEYIENQWAVPLTAEELEAETKPVYYLPHHGVHRPDKPSTPLRVVFDPACTYKGTSLNSFLHKGPCLIGDLLGVLIRFREDNVAFVGDISKMFLQILLTNEDSQVHRFLWRSLVTTAQPTIYRLTRVTFGDKPSPDMASFIMLKLADEFKLRFPEAAAILQRDRYVDDLIHSCGSPAQAVERMEGLNDILASGSFRIKEWFCSSEEAGMHMKEDKPCAMSTGPSGAENQQELKSVPGIAFDKQDNVKTLGVCWDPSSDTLCFQVKDFEPDILTKRTVLSKLCMLYDPLGLASVITVRARIAMQAIWRLKDIGWDDALPNELRESWQNLFQDMKKLESIQFPRCLIPRIVSGMPELHVFADASAVAYGAVAYLLWPTPDGSSVRLVSAKSRVAPLRQATIPRLELMAAMIASRLAKTIHNELREKPTVILWSDSQIVLHWIQSDSITLKAFVGVRIAEIQSTWSSSSWRFVPTHLNPADDLSRGVRVEEIGGRWMNGPDFLQRPKSDWPEQPPFPAPLEDVELRKPKPICTTQKVAAPIDCRTLSDWQRLLRVTSYCLRFVHNLKCKLVDPSEMMKGDLCVEEISEAENFWIHAAQAEISGWTDRYRDLAPFMENGIIRVGGRLGRSTLPFEQIHPVILPA